MKLNFNHPVKELIWTSDKAYTDAKLVLNGHDRFQKQEEEYFQLRQPMDHHTAVPKQNLPSISHAFPGAGQFSSARFTADAAHGTELDIHTTTAEGASRVSFGTNSLVVRGDTGETSTITNFGVGRKIAIQVHTLGNVNAYTGSTLPAVGDVFYSTITAASTVNNENANNVLTITCENFQSVKNGETITALVTGGGGAKVNLFFLSDEEARTSQLTDKVNVYSFALKPEEHQPSGTCNFSRIDNAKLNFTDNPHSTTMNVYAVNYNVLRIMSGMGGLAYSN